MQAIDTLFSDWILMTVIVFILLMGFMALSFYNPFRNKTLNICYKITMYVLSASGMILPTFTYYGLADEFKKMTIGKNSICLYEEYERGAEISETVCRLSIIDRKTGIRKDRMYIGSSGELIGQKGDSVCYRSDEKVILLHTGNLKNIFEISKEKWPSHFKELEAGISQLYSNQRSSEPRISYLTLECKNGNRYWMDPFSKTIHDQEPKGQVITGIYSTGYDLYKVDSAKTSNLLGWNSAANSQRQKISSGNTILFPAPCEDSFIDPKYLCIDTFKKVVVFSHFTNTDKEKIIVEAKDFNFKTLWKKTSEELGATDKYNEDLINCYQYRDGILYFNIGGFLIALEPKRGTLLYKSRL